ncbi:MAG: 1-deoxy-D-xylulose-5-phosphate reductoisomerase [Kyrpidia sp.]|nr:1-deoxy-D-xylulose-5-phosphate reductoisomerase [Kyrpidia sp.]
MNTGVAILGSTGSIGQSTLDVVSARPDRFSVKALAAGKNVDRLISQIAGVRPELVAVADAEKAAEVKAKSPVKVDVVWGEEGLVAAATHPDADIVVSALVGFAGLIPTLRAIREGKRIALANKETLVAAGELVMREIRRFGAQLIPVDSEHSAIFQCLRGERASEVARLWLTASGGALRDWSRQEMQGAEIADVLRHPNWTMGHKITVDSATLMNKGLEVIEAHWLFEVPYERIEVVIHPESIVHSAVEFVDGAVMAQMAVPDMRIPIQYALSFPERWPGRGKPFRLSEMGALHFHPPDPRRFPCLGYAYDAGRSGGTMPAVLNAANEVAVQWFLSGRIPFLAIEEILRRVMDMHEPVAHPDLDTILWADAWARETASGLAEKGKVAR